MPSRAVIVAGLVASFLVAEAVAAQVRALHNLSRQPAQIPSFFFSHRIVLKKTLESYFFLLRGLVDLNLVRQRTVRGFLVISAAG